MKTTLGKLIEMIRRELDSYENYPIMNKFDEGYRQGLRKCENFILENGGSRFKLDRKKNTKEKGA